jgi:hypothetical protein
VIAYEPVWAIGSGRTPTATEIAEVHASLREMLDKLVGEEAPALLAFLHRLTDADDATQARAPGAQRLGMDAVIGLVRSARRSCPRR